MHDSNRYSVFCKNEDKSLKTLTYSEGMAEKISLIADVPADDPMWLEISLDTRREEDDTNYWGYQWVKIHIHSAEDINGGGWDKGKHGRGQTQVIE